MPEVALKLIPGVNANLTPTLNESGISSCNLIRFRDKLPQKLGGWERFYQFNVDGVPRDVHPWEDLNAIKHLAVGTTTELDVITNGTLQDITPQTLTSDFTPDFSTTNTSTTVDVDDPNILNVSTYDAVFFNTPVSVGGVILQGAYPISVVSGATTYQIIDDQTATATVASGGAVPEFVTTLDSSIVTVNFDDHGLAEGDSFTFPISTTGGGVTILGTYTVLDVPSADQFTIASSTAATSAATFSMNGGDAQIVYYIALGPLPGGTGYGVGGYGIGGYGSGIVPDNQTGTTITATNWSLDNWGKILLACPKDGGIYQWSPDGGFVNARLVYQAPVFNGGIFIAMPAQILVAWASIEEGDQQQDPLIVRWSDQEDFENWTAAEETQAGSFRIPTGSKIVAGFQGPQQALIFTDLDLYAMQYLGPPEVFGFNQIGSGCGLLGQHAVTTMRGIVYWMSSGNFFMLGAGGVQEIPCTVWDVVFQDLDTVNQHKSVAGANSSFDEVTFYFPSLSGGTGEIDSYAKFNIEEKTWDNGLLPRTAWSDQSVLGEPIGTTPNGIIYQHETSPDADGAPLMATFTTGWFVIAEGQALAFVDWFFPDMKWGGYGGAQTASVLVLIEGTNYPNETPVQYGPFTMTQAKTFINCRLRKRMIRLTFSSSDIGSFWRLGNLRYRVAQDGRR
jgi:hypothetical protein